jgi:hypothetical protein
MMTKILRSALIFVAFLTFIGCSSDDNGGTPEPDPTTGTLTGTVTTTLEDDTSMPLADVSIEVVAAGALNTSATTDANGVYSIPGLTAGNYTVSANLDGYVEGAEENVSIEAGESTTVDFELEASNGTENSIRINSGGPALSVDDLEWAADNSFENGTTYSDEIDIANTTNPQLYQSERYANDVSLTYEIPVENGTYNVNLHFAEIFFGVPGAGSAGGEGSRVFDIDIEDGLAQINDYDIVVVAGGSATAVVESFTDIVVEDGSLTIVLTSVVENAKISGIEVLLP